MSVSVGITLSYFLNHFIVFRHKHKPTKKLFAKFFVVTGFSVILIQTTVIYLTRPIYAHLIQSSSNATLLHDEKSITLNLAKLTAILVGMVWNYILYSKFVFKNAPVDEEAKAITSIT